MKKEALTLNNIKQDLTKIAECKDRNNDEWRQAYIIPFTVLAIVVGFFLKNVFVALLIFSFAVYHIVKYVEAIKEYKAQKKAIDDVLLRGDISISVERLSHIGTETIYEPHSNNRFFLLSRRSRVNLTKEVTCYYFMSGARWRVPNVEKHYTWSKEYYISSAGLKNISIKEDEFFYISLQGYHEIAYIYPCKCFVLDEKLKENKEF